MLLEARDPSDGADGTARRRLAVVLHAICLVPLAAVLVLAVVTTGAYAVGWSPNIVTSGSMAPWLQPGDIVLAQPSQPADLHQGQIVVFRSGAVTDGRITHRLVGRDGAGNWITKGDANAVADPVPVAPADITGIIRLTIPRVGLPSLWLREGSYLPLLLWGGLLSLSAWAAVRTYRPATGALEDPPKRTRRRGRRGVADRFAARLRLSRPYPLLLVVTGMAVGGLLAFTIWWASLAVKTGSYVWVAFTGGGLVLLIPAVGLLSLAVYTLLSGD